MLNSNMTPSQNSYICEYYPDDNFSDAPYLYISRFTGLGVVYRSLIQFEFDPCCSHYVIPRASTIKSANLLLYVNRNEIPAGSITLAAHRIYNPFSESFVTWNTQPAFLATADATATISAGFLGELSVDVTNLAKGWHNGTIPNNGMMLTGDESNNTLVEFRSTRYPNSTTWPKLVINYVEGIQTIYSPETINIPATGTVASTPINLGGTKKDVTFLVKIISTAATPPELDTIDAYAQVSTDNIDYYNVNDSIYNKINFAVSMKQTGEYARVLLSSQTGEATVIVTPITWEI